MTVDTALAGAVRVDRDGSLSGSATAGVTAALVDPEGNGGTFAATYTNTTGEQPTVAATLGLTTVVAEGRGPGDETRLSVAAETSYLLPGNGFTEGSFGDTTFTVGLANGASPPSTLTPEQIAGQVGKEVTGHQMYQAQRELLTESIGNNGVERGFENYQNFLNEAPTLGIVQAAGRAGLTGDAVSRLDQAIRDTPPAERGEAFHESAQSAINATVRDLDTLSVDTNSSVRQGNTAAPSKELQTERPQEPKLELSHAL